MTVLRKSAGMAMEWRTILANIDKALNGVARATPDALMYACLPVFEKSQTYCPVKSGRLKRSGYIMKVAASGRAQAKVEIGYARGGSPHYGVYVHENLMARHSDPTRSKFLQAAVEEERGHIVERVAEYLRNQMSGSGAGVGGTPDEVKGS
jgi:hypothetical protein